MIATKFKVKITDGNIMQNGVNIGTMGSGREIWIDGVTGVEGERNTFVGRFKYFRAGVCARSFVKFVFSRLTMAEYQVLYKAGESPCKIAEDMGWEHPNLVLAAKKKADAAALQARFVYVTGPNGSLICQN
jgi:hypothetical protein